MVKLNDLKTDTKIESLRNQLKLVHKYLSNDVNKMLVDLYADKPEMDSKSTKFCHIVDKLGKIIEGGM